jgi:hypothetical protein
MARTPVTCVSIVRRSRQQRDAKGTHNVHTGSSVHPQRTASEIISPRRRCVMKWEEILAAITGSGQTPEQFATELQKGAQPFFQAIFDKGHGAATVKATAKETELTGRITALETERDAAVTRATDAEKKVPEIATIRAQYDEQIKTLKEKHKTELQTRDETAKSQRIEQAKQSTASMSTRPASRFRSRRPTARRASTCWRTRSTSASRPSGSGPTWTAAPARRRAARRSPPTNSRRFARRSRSVRSRRLLTSRSTSASALRFGSRATPGIRKEP